MTKKKRQQHQNLESLLRHQRFFFLFLNFALHFISTDRIVNERTRAPCADTQFVATQMAKVWLRTIPNRSSSIQYGRMQWVFFCLWHHKWILWATILCHRKLHVVSAAIRERNCVCDWMGINIGHRDCQQDEAYTWRTQSMAFAFHWQRRRETSSH